MPIKKLLEEFHTAASPIWESSVLGPGEWVEQAKADLRTRGNGISTGFRSLDDKVQGIRPGDHWIGAGRTSMGKTGLVMNIAFNIAYGGHVVLAFHTESSLASIFARELSRQTGIDNEAIQSQSVGLFERPALQQATEKIEKASIYHVKTRDFEHILAIARSIGSATQLGLVVVDHVQGLKTQHKGNRLEQLGHIAHSLKALAEDLNCGVVSCSQINRQSEDSSRPSLRDLKGCGDLEEAADVVILLHRNGYYDRENPDAPEAEVHVAKHRDGKTGMLRAQFDTKTVTWTL